MVRASASGVVEMWSLQCRLEFDSESGLTYERKLVFTGSLLVAQH